MDAQYVSNMYTIDTEDTFACTKWMTDKGAEGVSGYIAYVILLFFYLILFFLPTIFIPRSLRFAYLSLPFLPNLRWI